MQFAIGEIVHHHTTKEEGRVVRLFKDRRRSGYIVACKNNGSGEEIEALWFPREIRESRERARKYRIEAIAESK